PFLYLRHVVHDPRERCGDVQPYRSRFRARFTAFLTFVFPVRLAHAPTLSSTAFLDREWPRNRIADIAVRSEFTGNDPFFRFPRPDAPCLRRVAAETDLRRLDFLAIRTSNHLDDRPRDQRLGHPADIGQRAAVRDVHLDLVHQPAEDGQRVL